MMGPSWLTVWLPVTKCQKREPAEEYGFGKSRQWPVRGRSKPWPQKKRHNGEEHRIRDKSLSGRAKHAVKLLRAAA
ncbi:unnamed protein product [Heligmosomoides polygyrus]|uniref:Secreted protein n=1 Tax=Heligmosomoides polygyrus TaxID=6339 RepID=A0A183G0Q4_HELPZ|nr:unnamed protein product [Heligmosomoides polygyrus]